MRRRAGLTAPTPTGLYATAVIRLARNRRRRRRRRKTLKIFDCPRVHPTTSFTRFDRESYAKIKPATAGFLLPAPYHREPCHRPSAGESIAFRDPRTTEPSPRPATLCFRDA
jgi:hypothetical protein